MQTEAGPPYHQSAKRQSILVGAFGGEKLGFGSASKRAHPQQRLMTQAMYQRARKASDLRRHAPTMLEPILDVDKLKARRRPGCKLDGSLNTSFNLNMIQRKYQGLGQFLADSMEKKRHRCSIDTDARDSATMTRSVLATNTAHLYKTAQSTDRWMNTSMTTDSEPLARQTTRFMNDIINKSIDI